MSNKPIGVLFIDDLDGSLAMIAATLVNEEMSGTYRALAASMNAPRPAQGARDLLAIEGFKRIDAPIKIVEVSLSGIDLAIGLGESVQNSLPPEMAGIESLLSG